jgi:hypothetical protein
MLEPLDTAALCGSSPLADLLDVMDVARVDGRNDWAENLNNVRSAMTIEAFLKKQPSMVPMCLVVRRYAGYAMCTWYCSTVSIAVRCECRCAAAALQAMRTCGMRPGRVGQSTVPQLHRELTMVPLRPQPPSAPSLRQRCPLTSLPR